MDNVISEQAYFTPFASSPLLPLLLLSLANQKHTPETSQDFKSEYDYIIVGAGSAGSAMAGRLSEVPCVSVLLLEAGKAPPRLTEVPSIARYFVGTDLDWNYLTEPQTYSGYGLVNKQLVWPSGKALGGTSIFNAMLHVRGNMRDYNQWASRGATGWSYRDVLPYFKKLEDNIDYNNYFHGKGGPITVEKPRYDSELKTAVYEAASYLGYARVDSNAATQSGFFDFQANLRNSQRCSTAKAYLVPAENRTNLDIVSNAFVRKIVIKNRKATGVQFDYGGKPYEVRAKREVIVSAGTVNSAQLLMLSGVGPRRELEKHNITVIEDLPVGENFQDHQAAIMGFEASEDIAPFTKKLTNPDNIQTYIDNRTGPLASPEGVSNVAFLHNDMYTPSRSVPDHQIYFLEVDSSFAKTLGLKPEVYDQVFSPYENKTTFWCLSQILHPRSRGWVTLRSADPYDPPRIDPNYFESPWDLFDVVEGMRNCQMIGESEALQKIGVKPFTTLYPGCESFVENEDLYLMCQARTVLMTTSHQVGTVKMGRVEDPSTVVDPQLRVKRIRGLRVVDASIMPFIPSGNTNVPTIMVAEKASDMIKQTIKCA